MPYFVPTVSILLVSLRIAHVFNMANNGYQIVKALRKYTDIEADLIVDGRDFGMAFPIWEDHRIAFDPYKPDSRALEEYSMPDWVKVYHREACRLPINQMANLFSMVKEYDLLHLHPFSPIPMQFQRRPFVIHEAGWLRTLSRDNTTTGKLARRAYQNADCIVMTNPDLYGVLRYLKHKRDLFIPFLIDMDQYCRDSSDDTSDELVFFSPSRHQWDIKGNDRLLRGFARFLKKRKLKAKLILVEWGSPEHVEKSKQLIEQLRIEREIVWQKPMSKPLLIETYNKADAVFDQFVIGGYGTTAPEAMACERPVVIFFRPFWNMKCYGEIAPVLNASNDEEICRRMIELEDPQTRIKYGKAGREYVLRHHDPRKLAGQYLKLYQELLA